MDIPGYDILEQVGEGGMAKVYRARHQRLDRIVAVKVLLSRYAEDPSFAERFMREARIAANLNHPNIVQIYDVDQHQETLFLTMEYVGGGDLVDSIRSAPSNQQSLNIVQQLADALDYAHERGYIHRDIKPANILFRENGSVAVSDFGIAKAMNSDTHMTQTGLVVGTPSYMSPEQARGEILSGRADLYSLAVIIYQLVLGQLPFQADSSISMAIKHISEPIPNLPQRLQDFQDFFNIALAKNPEERFATGKALTESLTQAVDSFQQENDADSTVIMQMAQADETQLATELAAASNASSATSGGNNGTTSSGSGAGSETGTGITPFSRLTHDTIHMMFVQINRFFLSVKDPDHKLRALVLLILLLNIVGFGFYFFNKSATQSPTAPTLSPAQIAQLGQWVSLSQTQLNNDNLTGEGDDNALFSFNKILELSPNDPYALDGIAEIQARLSALATQDIESDKLQDASEILAVLQSIDEEAAATETVQEALQRAYAKQNEVFDKDFDTALNLAKQNNLEGAVNALSKLASKSSYKDLKASNPALENAVYAELDKLANQLNQEASNDAEQREFNSAKTKLTLAEKAAQAAHNSSFATDIRNKKTSVTHKQNQINRANAVATYLSKAKNAVSENRSFQPAKNNAVYFYKEALTLDSNNKAAHEGLRNVADLTEQKTVQAITNQQFSIAKQQITQLTQLNTAYQQHTSKAPLISRERIATLQSDLKQAERNAKRTASAQKKVTALYQKAYAYLEENRATKADKVYGQINKLSPNDGGLEKLGHAIADAYVAMAQREIDGKDWEDVEVWVSRGLKHNPNHAKLLSQRAYANTMLQKR